MPYKFEILCTPNQAPVTVMVLIALQFFFVGIEARFNRSQASGPIHIRVKVLLIPILQPETLFKGNQISYHLNQQTFVQFLFLTLELP